MSHIADVKLTSYWTSLDTYITVDSSAQYIIVNSSPDIIYAVESATEDIDEAIIGVPVEPNDWIQYKKGSQTLYLKNGYVPVVSGEEVTQVKLSNITINKVDA